MDATPVEIRRVEDRELHITWADGHRTVYANRYLRETCPCAACVDEVTGVRTLDPATVRPDVRARAIDLVGRYAIKIAWSDGHATGLYTFTRLRADCPCPACRPDAAASGA